MKALPDTDELAAVVADGRAFDWLTLGAGRDVRTLAALWRAVRAQLPGEIAGVRAPRARLRWGVLLLSLAALAKAAAAAMVAALGLKSANPMQAATLVSFNAVGTSWPSRVSIYEMSSHRR